MKNLQSKTPFASAPLVLAIALSFALAISLACSIQAATPESPLLNTNREAVSFSWAITDSYVPKPMEAVSNTAESVEYWQIISGSELTKGVSISTTAPGALIRISELKTSANSKTQGPNPLELEIETPNGEKLANGKAMSLTVSPQSMRDAGSPFPDGTAGFQLDPSVGTGTFILRNTSALNANAQYTLHVFDKHSGTRLSITRDKASYKSGETLNLSGNISDSSDNALAISELSAYVLTPMGNSFALQTQKSDTGEFKASLPLTMQVEFGGLYEAYFDASTLVDGIAVKRRVKTAFALVKPSAEISLVGAGSAKDGLSVSLNVSDAGRYEIRGVLYGTDTNGAMSPFMATSTAQWLEAGTAELNLNFNQAQLSASTLSAPYELRHLGLKDQSRMGNLDMSAKTIPIID